MLVKHLTWSWTCACGVWGKTICSFKILQGKKNWKAITGVELVQLCQMLQQCLHAVVKRNELGVHFNNQNSSRCIFKRWKGNPLPHCHKTYSCSHMYFCYCFALIFFSSVSLFVEYMLYLWFMVMFLFLGCNIHYIRLLSYQRCN